MTRRPTLLTLATLFALTHSARADSWSAQPLVVHEWGVHEFDWSQPTPPPLADLPPYIYTDTHPGQSVPAPTTRVKDLPPDSGIRKKPILYFYPPEATLGQTIIGVELRFAQGHANAWYPQSNIYRTPDVTAGAVEPDWAAWQKAHASRRFDPKQQKPIPDDPRMELAWYNLALTKTPPPTLKLPGENLPPDHWTKRARVPNAAFINNGSEVEQYLFYEGATREKPAITLLSASDMRTTSRHVINISDRPLYNLFAIYHSAGRTWVGYLPTLDPIKPAGNPGSAGDTLASLPIPNFTKDFHDWTPDKDLPAATTGRLLAALTEGGSVVINNTLRDPADPQGPTASATLYPDEAAALEKIWHDDFFTAAPADKDNTLTILYRESPAALDAAMPLHLHTDMYHYIQLSRCGLVLNKNLDLVLLDKLHGALASAPYNNTPDRETQLTLLRQNPIPVNAELTFLEKAYPTTTTYAATRKLLNLP